MPERPDVLTADEVAEWMRASRSTVLEWARLGMLDRLPMRKVRITRESVERMLRGDYDGGDGRPRRRRDREAPEGRPAAGVHRDRRSPGVPDGPGSDADSPIDVGFDAARMTHAWAILEAETNPNRWEPDRYNAAAFVRALLDKYEWLATATLADLAPGYARNEVAALPEGPAAPEEA